MRSGDVTRREVVMAGGGLAAALLGAGLGGQRSAGAQPASPEALPLATPVAGAGLEGRYVGVRSRELTGTPPAEEVLATIREGYVPLLRAIPGFGAYLGVIDPESRRSAFVIVFDDRAGVDESTRQAGAWLTENNYAYFQGEPVVREGPIGVTAGVGGAATTGSLAGGTEGDYLVMRSRTLKPDRSGTELQGLIRDGFVPLLESVPGFVAYLAVVNEETRDQFSLGIYADKAGADESTRRAAEWGAQGAADFVEGDPIVFEGVIGLAVVG